MSRSIFFRVVIVQEIDKSQGNYAYYMAVATIFKHDDDDFGPVVSFEPKVRIHFNSSCYFNTKI